MAKRILFCASTASHINNFHLPYLKVFHDNGYEVWVAAKLQEPVIYADHTVDLPFAKKIYSLQNVKAIFIIKKLLEDQSFEVVSTHTALASAVIRMAVFLLKKKPKVFCTVHGYLFSKSDGIKKLLLLIPEKICSYITDVLMVMNHEDLEIAKQYKLYNDKLYYIDGMGVDPSRFTHVAPSEKSEHKKQMGFTDEDFIFVYVAEFSKRKNHKLLINAFAESGLANAHLLLAGDGKTLNECKQLVKQLGQTNKIHFLGYVNDVTRLYAFCDAAVSPSLSEGLPFNIIEAMGCGLPVIVSDIKGHRELAEQSINGLLFHKKNQQELINCLKEMYFFDYEQRLLLGQAGIKKAEAFSLESVFNKIMNIYQNNLKDCTSREIGQCDLD